LRNDEEIQVFASSSRIYNFDSKKYETKYFFLMMEIIHWFFTCKNLYLAIYEGVNTPLNSLIGRIWYKLYRNSSVVTPQGNRAP
jgi:hypothetical protein